MFSKKQESELENYVDRAASLWCDKKDATSLLLQCAVINNINSKMEIEEDAENGLGDF